MNVLTDCAILLVVFLIAFSNGSSARFDKITRPSCGSTRLSPGWVDKSRLSCAAKCKARFPAECHSFMYNKNTKVCTPGGDISIDNSSPTSAEGDLYYQSNLHFNVISSGSSTVNVAFFYGRFSYTDAEANCKCLNSHLFVVDNSEKWHLLNVIIETPSFTWIGLDDRAEEGKFVWANSSRVIDPAFKASIFKVYQPDNGSGLGPQNCAAVWPYTMKLDDIECENGMSHICERPT